MPVQQYRADWGQTQGVNAALVQNLTRLATQIGTNIGANFRDAFMVAGKAWADSIRQGKQMQFQADMAEAEQVERLGANIGRGLENYARMSYQREQDQVVAGQRQEQLGQREEQLAETTRHHKATESYYRGESRRRTIDDLMGRVGGAVKSAGKAAKWIAEHELKRRNTESLIESRKATGGGKPPSLLSQIGVVRNQIKDLDKQMEDMESGGRGAQYRTPGELPDEPYTEWNQADATEHAREQDKWWKVEGGKGWRRAKKPYKGTPKDDVSPHRRKLYDDLKTRLRKAKAELRRLRSTAVPGLGDALAEPTLAPAMQDNALIPLNEREAELIREAKAMGKDEDTIRSLLFDLRSGNFPLVD